jgi:hypothetical protein
MVEQMHLTGTWAPHLHTHTAAQLGHVCASLARLRGCQVAWLLSANASYSPYVKSTAISSNLNAPALKLAAMRDPADDPAS